MNIGARRTILPALASAAGAAICLLGHSSAVAHHSANALYEMDGDFEIAGEVTAVRWRNPHILVTVRVTEEGSTGDWVLEGSSAAAMRGVPDGSIAVGDSIRAAGRPGRRGRQAIFASNLLLKDGREIVFLGTPRWTDNVIGESAVSALVSERGPRRDDASSGIFGVWFARLGFDGDEEAGIWGGDIELTAEGAAIRDQFDPSGGNNPFISCTRGIPEILTGLGPLEFVDQGDQILFRFQEFDIVRPIMMGPDAEANRPPKSAARPYGDVGYSTGYWEGDDTLAVRTTGMNFPYYDQSGLAQTPEAEIVERWTLIDEGNALRYELTVTDPATFVRPVVQTKTWHWAPDRQIEPYNCDYSEERGQVVSR